MSCRVSCHCGKEPTGVQSSQSMPVRQELKRLREDLGVQAARAELEAGREANTKLSEGTQSGNESQIHARETKRLGSVMSDGSSPWDFRTSHEIINSFYS